MKRFIRWLRVRWRYLFDARLRVVAPEVARSGDRPHREADRLTGTPTASASPAPSPTPLALGLNDGSQPALGESDLHCQASPQVELLQQLAANSDKPATAVSAKIVGKLPWLVGCVACCNTTPTIELMKRGWISIVIYEHMSFFCERCSPSVDLSPEVNKHRHNRCTHFAGMAAKAETN